MSLRYVPGGEETLAEIQLTCDQCASTSVTVRDVVPPGWIEARDIGLVRPWGHVSERRREGNAELQFCRSECVVLFFAGRVRQEYREGEARLVRLATEFAEVVEQKRRQEIKGYVSPLGDDS